MAVVLQPFKSFGQWYLKTAKSHPFNTAFWTSGIKTCAADAFAQLVVERKDELDWTRNISFTVFGFLYLGGVQYYLYNVKMVQWCAGITNQVGHAGVSPLKTLIDQGIHHPFIYFPTFFTCKALVEKQPHPLEHAWHKWQNEAWDSCKALWSIWVPAQLLNFAVVPRYLRVPFAAGVSFVWCVVLSVMQGGSDKAPEPAEQQLSSPYEASRPRWQPALVQPALCRQLPASCPAPSGLPRPGLQSLLPRHSAALPLL